MDEIEIRAVKKHFALKGLSAADIQIELDSTLKNSSFWLSSSVQDDEKLGNPKIVTADEIVKKIHIAVLKDRRLKVHELAVIANISVDHAHYILHNVLDMKKLCTRWVPRLLPIDEKLIRMNVSQECLDLFKRNSAEFFKRFITADETWIHYYMPETKQQFKQSIKADESAPQKAKTVPSLGKVMASVFWDSHGVMVTDYLEEGKVITGEHYASLLDQLKDAIQTKRPHIAKKKVLYYHDDTPAHTSPIVAPKLCELNFKVLPQAPYSPDLTPSDYFLFSNLKKWLSGQKFTSSDEIKAETNACLVMLNEQLYSMGVKDLKRRWSKCIELSGDYVEV